MSIDVIRSIKQAESEAEQIIRQSVVQARQIAIEAQDQSYKLVEQAEVEAEEQSREIINKAEKSVQEETGKIMEKVLTECVDIKEQARVRIQDAVDMILGRIVRIHGDR